MKKAAYPYLAAIIIASGVLGYLSILEGHFWGDDFALYIRQAKSIVEGATTDCFIKNSFIVANSSYPVGPNLYPWGFPLLLSPVYYAFGLDIFAMKLYMLLFFLLSLFATFLVFREKLSMITLLLLVAIFAFNPVFITFHNNVLSDMPFHFFALISIYLISRFAIEGRFFINRSVSFIMLGFFIFYSYFIRSNGVALLGSLLAIQAFAVFSARRNLKAYLKVNWTGLLPFAVFVALLWVFAALLPEGSLSHTSHFWVTPELLLNNLKYYFFIFADFFGKYQPGILSKVTVFFALTGMIKAWRRDGLFIIYSALTLLIFIIWPYKQGIRFIFSILPFYIYFCFVGLRAVFGAVSKKLLKADYGETISQGAGLGLAALFLVQSFTNAYLFTGVRNFVIDGPFRPASQEMLSFVRDHTDEKEVMVFFKPRALSLLTNGKPS